MPHANGLKFTDTIVHLMCPSLRHHDNLLTTKFRMAASHAGKYCHSLPLPLWNNHICTLPKPLSCFIDHGNEWRHELQHKVELGTTMHAFVLPVYRGATWPKRLASAEKQRPHCRPSYQRLSQIAALKLPAYDRAHPYRTH